jgi:ABC-type sugar transport system ATPase subunit
MPEVDQLGRVGSPAPGSTHVELRRVTKQFGGVDALTDVTLGIAAGSIHALVGENGAGKSTLGRIIAGVHQPDGGEVVVNGRPARYRSPRDAIADGVTIIAQELTLVPRRTVIDNVFLGSESRRAGLRRPRESRSRFATLSSNAGFDIPGDAIVGDLRVADQQKVEILRALARDASLIVMDEPTAALTRDEAAKLFQVVRRLTSAGTTVVYVSHFLEEVLALADTVTSLRDGRLVRTSPAADETTTSLVAAMLGRTLDVTFPEKRSPDRAAPVVLSVRGLSRPPAYTDVSFEVRAGEIVGIAGLIGSGRSEVARAIFGADRASSGEIRVLGQPYAPRHPHHAVRAGVAMVPEDRKGQGLHMSQQILFNVTLPHGRHVSRGGVLSRRAQERGTRALARRVALPPSLKRPVLGLSGGNQQRVLFAKWLFRTPALLIADEPTRGVDVGAKRGIYELLVGLAAEGMAVLLISSEVEEVLGLSHTILIMRRGRLVAEFDGTANVEDEVVQAALATDAYSA